MRSDGSTIRRGALRAPSGGLDYRPIVAVPARNEEERLPALLRALAEQSWLAGTGRQLDVVIVLNNTDDRSRAAAEAAAAGTMLRLHLVECLFPAPFAHVGAARRLGMDLACTLSPDTGRTILLTTDADAVPAPDWIAANLAAIERGADLVGGLIIGDRREEALLGPAFAARARNYLLYAELCDRLACHVDPLAHDPWPRHRDHTGASLAVRASVYEAVAGLPAASFREDLAFVARVRQAGFRLRHDPAVRVEVSARTHGRAAGGMADTLAQWVAEAEAGRPHLVEAPQRVLARAIRRSLLRDAAHVEPDGLAAIATRLGLKPAELHDDDGRVLPPHLLVERHAPDEPDAPGTVPVLDAIAELRALIGEDEAREHAA
ncbi:MULTISPECIES: glycosyltransferase family 2 protein [Aurantimonas]|uniref:glycosyltransferase n=1 Tax=Aurantimonas TaxID=182269 RepID=UPI003515B173